MVQYCVVPLCRNNARNKGISFFSFPRQKDIRKKWLVKIRRDERKNVDVSDAMRVCSAHFLNEDFISSKNGKRRLLRKDAVPSIFNFTSPRNLKVRRQLVRNSVDITSLSNISPEIINSSVDLPGQINHSDVTVGSPYASEETGLHEKLKTAEEKVKAADVLIAQLQNEISLLKAEMESSAHQNEALNQKLKEAEKHKCSSFTLDSIMQDDQLLTYYTGFDNSKMLKSFLDFINHENKISFSKKLSISDQILVVLSKLRQGFDNIDLSFRFSISTKHISKIFVNWINVIYFQLGCLNIFPSRDIIFDNSPQIFKEKYPKTFMILDCTELKIESPSDLVLQSQSYSTYKSHNTMKGLIGCDPNGGLLFVSSLFTGSISDKRIVEQSGLLKLLSEKLKAKELLPKDAVMFDKGFSIATELEALKLDFNVPPMANDVQFPEEEVYETRSIASVRVHVERLIRRYKSFKILSGVIPITFMPHLNQIWTVCCILTGFRTITKNVDSRFPNDALAGGNLDSSSYI